MAATLLASLAGCGSEYVPLPPGRRGEDPVGPDGGNGATDPPLPPPPPATTGFERCGTELCLELADPANVQLRAVDGARVITFEGKRLLIIRIEAARFLVLSAVCTHSGCTVRYAPPTTDILCPCHGSTFALDGAVTNGPADAPLAMYETSYDPSTDVVRVMLG
jgi:cytochrome b6-f complex iron-sulfur subunit